MKILLHLIFLLNVHLAFSQVIYPSKHYTTHDGIPQIQITDVLQDSLGYIWFSTKKGVARFNGEAFKTLSHSTLSNKSINHLSLDHKGRVYFFTAEIPPEVIQYNGKNYRVLDLPQKKGIQINQSLLVKNELWFANGTKKLSVYDLDSLKLTKEINLTSEVLKLLRTNEDNILAISVDGKKIIDVKTNETIDSTQRGKFSITRQTKNTERLILIEDHNQQRTKSIYAKNGKSVQLRYSYYLLNPKKLIALDYSAIEETQLFALGDTMLQINASGISNKYFLANSTRPQGLFDTDGHLWVTHENGIEFFPKDHFSNFPEEFVSDIWAMNSLNGKHYYSSFSKGIFEVDLSNAKQKKLFTQYSDRFYNACVPDNKGNLYVPGNRFLWKYNGKFFEAISLGKSNPSLYCYYDQPSDHILVGGFQKVGVLNSQLNKIDYYSPKDSHLSRHVVSIAKADKNSYWIGSYSSLSQFNVKEKSFENFTNLFPEGFAGAIAIEPHKSGVWIGNKLGLWYLDKNKKIRQISPDFFKDEFILALKVVNENILAIGTSNGFTILDLSHYYKEDEPRLKNYNFRNGFMGQEVAQNGFYQEDSILYIPSSTCLSSVNINQLKFNQDFTKINITTVNEKEVKWYNEQVVELAEGDNQLIFTYEGIGFNRPFKTQYSYRLLPLNENWSKWTTDDKALYNNLESGTYTFEVKKKNNHLDYNNKQTTDQIKVKVDLPIYQEPYFYKYAFVSLLILGILLLLSLIRYFQTKRLTQVQEQQIKYLEVQALQSQMNPHFIFNVLSTIQSLVLDNKTEEANKHLISFSKLIRRFLDASISNNLTTENINKDNFLALSEELELLKLYIDFELLLYGNKFDYTIDVAVSDLNNILLPPLIIQPFVENAIKHGLLKKKHKGKLTIRFEELEETILCTIEDDGIGREQASTLQNETQKLFKSQGSRLVIKRISILNALDSNIRIQTIDKVQPQTGTIVKIYFDKKSLL